MATNLMKEIVLSHREKYLKEVDRLLREIDEGKLPLEVKSTKNFDRSLLCKSCMKENPDRFTRCINKKLDTLFLISIGGNEKYCCEKSESEEAVIIERGFGYITGLGYDLRSDINVYRDLSWNQIKKEEE